MGLDEVAVVDPHLRVHGIDGLRVADASVIPTVPTGNTNAPSIMIGERVADFVAGERPAAGSMAAGAVA
jgi:choline dehydrogenase